MKETEKYCEKNNIDSKELYDDDLYEIEINTIRKMLGDKKRNNKKIYNSKESEIKVENGSISSLRVDLNGYTYSYNKDRENNDSNINHHKTKENTKDDYDIDI